MPRADINVTPLIDVLLVLLILFMVVAPPAPKALDAALPAAPDPIANPEPTSLVLEVSADELRLNATPVLTLPELEERLRSAFEQRRDRTLFVRPAAHVRYSRLIDALDAAKGAGASRIGLVEAP
jgi:biopolymer transport protein ExbD